MPYRTLTTNQVPIKPEIKPDSELPPNLKREREPEMEDFLASTRPKKAERKAKVVEVIDLLDD